jgi:transposase
VKTVAMQSTGVYWIPIYEILEERGIQVYLVNARHTKNLPGRKSDVQESLEKTAAPFVSVTLIRGGKT